MRENSLRSLIFSYFSFNALFTEPNSLSTKADHSNWKKCRTQIEQSCPTELCNNKVLEVFYRDTTKTYMSHPVFDYAFLCRWCKFCHERETAVGYSSRAGKILRQLRLDSDDLHSDNNAGFLKLITISVYLWGPPPSVVFFTAERLRRTPHDWLVIDSDGAITARWKHALVEKILINPDATGTAVNEVADHSPNAQLPNTPEINRLIESTPKNKNIFSVSPETVGEPPDDSPNVSTADPVTSAFTDSDSNIKNSARELLIQLAGKPDAQFHNDQLETIIDVAKAKERVFLVQRTGWGKSAVYFIATQLLRSEGSGPTIVFSPLLALMRNQVNHATRLGLVAKTLNSANQKEWSEIEAMISEDTIDILFIAPERLSNNRFQQLMNSLGGYKARSGLVVVDEAHCISDWGHDFRPDYRRIKQMLENMPDGVPVVACTATANDRVVEDVLGQLATSRPMVSRRGPLSRSGLLLASLELPSRESRLVWLAHNIPKLPLTGIIYCLTVDDTYQVSDWLNSQGISAAAYTGQTQPELKNQIEQGLLDHRYKAVVATKALGMGFDMPDLGFVVHFQSPGSVIEYYQQVGRAGRQLDRSYAILLRGEEDWRINEYFRNSAFPSSEDINQVLALLNVADKPMTLGVLQGAVNIRRKKLLNLLKNLTVDGFLQTEKGRGPWTRTAKPYTVDHARVESIKQQREQEWAQMVEYGSATSGCRMIFLQNALDDPQSREPCGLCDLCSPSEVRFSMPSQKTEASHQVQTFLEAKEKPIEIIPRKKWVDDTSISESLINETGLVLCSWNTGRFGQQIKSGKQIEGQFSDLLVEALVDMYRRWECDTPPTWVTWIPSNKSRDLVPNLALRIAEALNIPSASSLTKKRQNPPQKSMQNSFQQSRNVANIFEVVSEPLSGAVLLVDDVVDSRWTITHAGASLRRAGVSKVIPIALADSNPAS